LLDVRDVVIDIPEVSRSNSVTVAKMSVWPYHDTTRASAVMYGKAWFDF